MSCRDARWYLRNSERRVPDGIVTIFWRSCFMSCVLQGLTLTSTKQRTKGSWCQSCYILKELFYELCLAGTHADIYETEDGGRCVLDAGGYIFNSEAHPIDPAALGDCIFYCKGQCWGSVTFWCGSGSADPHLWLKDPDPTSFFSDFKDAKQIIFFLFFSYNLPAGTLPSVLFFAKVLCKHFILQALFQSARHLYEKR